MANEWTVKMHINDIFDEEITRITASMLPKNFSADARTTRAVQEQIAALIDELGEESATSQGLKKVITSAEKLRTNPKHAVYLLKDYRAKEGKGEIIGLLKVGRKHLFLFDSKETVHEVEPLCVLDFYIVHNRQRMGFGRMLFDFVLNELEVTASQMAIDGPSDKMEKFLSRNFGVEKLIRQNNNFAIAPNFFDRSDYEISNCGRDVSDEPAAAVGRFAAPRPNSDIANVIHGAAAGQEDAARWADAMEMETDEFVAAAPGAVEHAAEAQGAADHASEAQGAAAHAAEAQGAAAHAAVAQGAAAHAAVAQGAAAHAAEVPDAAPAASAAPRMRAVPRGRPVPARAAPVVPAPLAAWPSQGRRGRSRPDQRTLARTVLSALPEDGGWMHVDDLLAATCQSNVEVSHVFLCTMFLAQSGNVRILHHAPGEVNRTNAFSLQLITTDESLYLGAISIFDQQMH